MRNRHVAEPFRDLLNDFINEAATESVNAEVHQREDRWVCGQCEYRARDKFDLARHRSDHDWERGERPFIEGE